MQLKTDALGGADVLLTAQAVFNALLSREVHWVLVSQDSPTLEIVGQFHAQELSENTGGNWAQTSTVGRAQPILQFVAEELHTLTFTAKVFAKHEGVLGTGLLADDVSDLVNRLQALPSIDPKFGRPHIWSFGIGKQFERQVVVTGVGSKFDRFRGRDGSIRGVVCQISLARYEPYDLSTLVQAESLVTPVRTGETYEHIAARELGDPLLGEALRRRNPDRRTLTEGDLVHVPRAKILRSEVYPLTPQSSFFREGSAQRQNRLNAFADRGATVPTHILLTDWGS